MSAPKPFRFPDNSQRVSIMGATGSGKTVLGAWLLSEADFERSPWVILDFKGDDLLSGIDRVKQIGINEVPKFPGVYRIQPHPSDEDGIDRFFWNVWRREGIGVYTDEGYMVPKTSKGFQACLTQGRAKRIPLITLSQRPVEISRFVFSEASMVAAFFLNDVRDQKTVQQFMPPGVLKDRLPDYHSRWYDVGQDQLYTLLPAPHPDELRNRIYDRLKPRRVWL